MDKIRVFIPAPGEDWVGDVQTDEISGFLNSLDDIKVVNDIDSADVVWLFSKWIWNWFQFQKLIDKKVITTVHHIVPEKQDPREFRAFDAFTDVYHVPNVHTERQLSEYTNKEHVRIPYWSNPERFDDKKVRFGALLSHDASLYYGFASMQRDTEGSSILQGRPAPKLEKGPDTFVNVVKTFKPSQVSVMLPGWRRDWIRNELRMYSKNEHGGMQPHDVVPSVYRWFRMLGLTYLMTSRHEGGPMSVIECSLMRLPILATDCGLASEVLHPDCVVCAPDDPDIIAKFRHAIITRQAENDDVIKHNKRTALKLDIKEHGHKFANLVRSVVK